MSGRVVQIATGGCDIAVAKRGLNLGERSTTVDGMRDDACCSRLLAGSLDPCERWYPEMSVNEAHHLAHFRSLSTGKGLDDDGLGVRPQR